MVAVPSLLVPLPPESTSSVEMAWYSPAGWLAETQERTEQSFVAKNIILVVPTFIQLLCMHSFRPSASQISGLGERKALDL